jgi:hypothetical protein
VKCQKYQLMNCQSMPLLSLTNNDQTLCVFSYPTCEVPHHDLWIVEAKSILSCEAADCERLRNPFVRNGLQSTVKSFFQSFPHNHGTKANHAVIAWDGTVRLHVHEHICDINCSELVLA